MSGRRAFLATLGAVALAGRVGPVSRPARAQAVGRTSMFLAYTSFAVRLAQGRDVLKSTAGALDADTFRQLCERFGASGVQADYSQLPVDDMPALAGIGGRFDGHGIDIEVSMPARYLETPEAYARAVRIARAVGASRARVALLSGRRYESFATASAWHAFVETWRGTLRRMRPEFDRHQFAIGIENHKDWLARELADLLHEVGTPYVGACLDFGNNLALLEEPDETIALLAPFAVTTHVKDMAVRPIEDGFELSEVPLGQGLLPLGRYVAAIRRARPDARFCLEMITRDPLRVPYRTDRYWVTFDAARRDPRRIDAFESRVLAHASPRPLPRVTGLSPAQQVAAEDENVRASVAHARRALALEAD